MLRRTYRENHENINHPKGQHQIQVHSFSQRNCFLIKDARVHYVVLKQQPQPHTNPTHAAPTNTNPQRERTPAKHHTQAVRSCEGNQKQTTPHPPPQGSRKEPLLLQDPTVCQTPNHHTHERLHDSFPHHRTNGDGTPRHPSGRDNHIILLIFHP